MTFDYTRVNEWADSRVATRDQRSTNTDPILNIATTIYTVCTTLLIVLFVSTLAYSQHDLQSMALTGDFFGGVGGTIVGLVTLFVIIAALRYQQQMVSAANLTLAEARKTTSAAEQQAMSAHQSLEDQRRHNAAAEFRQTSLEMSVRARELQNSVSVKLDKEASPALWQEVRKQFPGTGANHRVSFEGPRAIHIYNMTCLHRLKLLAHGGASDNALFEDLSQARKDTGLDDSGNSYLDSYVALAKYCADNEHHNSHPSITSFVCGQIDAQSWLFLRICTLTNLNLEDYLIVWSQFNSKRLFANEDGMLALSRVDSHKRSSGPGS